MSASLQLDELLNDSLELLSSPDVYLRLREVMQSENAGMNDVAEVILLDPALAARVLRIANSAFYGFPAEIDKVSRAVNILGMQRIHDLVLAASVSRAFDGLSNELLDINTFWYRSVQCGFLAKTIAEGAGMRDAESMFVRGLLHDIGHLVLFSKYPAESRAALSHADKGLQARLTQEQQQIGIDAIQLTAELVKAWQLPPTFVDSYRYLMEPESVTEELAREVAILHIAAQISSGIDSDLLLEEIVGSIRAPVWQIAGLPPEVGLPALDATAMEMVDAMYLVLTDSV